MRDIPKYIEKRLMFIVLYGDHIQKGLEANPGSVLRITNLNQRPVPQDTLDDFLSNDSIPKKVRNAYSECYGFISGILCPCSNVTTYSVHA